MNINDFRTAAYQKNAAEKNKNIKNQQDFVNSLPKFQNSEEIKQTNQSKFQNQQNNSQNQKKQSVYSKNKQLDEATDYLKSGGLIKVPVEKPQEDGKDSVYRRAAKFLLLIGEEEAAKILPHLPENQIEKIIPEIASIRTVTNEEAVVILEEFNALAKQTKTQGGLETAREMLEKAYGKKRAEQLLQKAVPNKGKIPFEYLCNADNEQIYLLLKDENIGVQTMVLSRIPAKKAAEIIKLMKPNEKTQVALRLAKSEPIDSEILRRVDQAMHEKFQNQAVEKAENIDGRNALAQILKKMDLNTEKEILSNLANEDKDLGDDIKNRLFTLEDAINADDRYIQQWLREQKTEDISYLIAGKPDDFRNKILQNVSINRKQEILEQEDILKPMPKSLCNDITNKFFITLRTAFEQGNLIVKNRNQEEFV